MEEKIQKTETEALAEIGATSDLRTFESAKNKYLGRKGLIAELFNEMKVLSPEEKKKAGALLNGLKMKAEEKAKEKAEALNAGSSKRASDRLDITLPGKRIKKGSINIITQVMDEMLAIFSSMGYIVAQGPEIETDYYNFEALNIPADHPSRDMWSTFYVSGGKLLRTHTSPVQVRFMEKNDPPFAAVFPGKVYRRDAADASHLPVFHQLEGLLVGDDITMSDLKGTLTKFLRKMFGRDRKVRFRPSFFPFTEPSAEVDVECFICGGKGCRLCKNTGWLEILGSGMVDPNVFPVSGFAFGMGIERIAMLKYGVDDIRVFFENDLRVLRQF
ncbi:MAG: phenylalanine--tRNA ligase subunit alpha [Candidatus Saganbacteria bacterium]|nr:phenylalanine--tRNA ligase subunit alpha [Candidatus Saganbacteria bacterium]